MFTITICLEEPVKSRAFHNREGGGRQPPPCAYCTSIAHNNQGISRQYSPLYAGRKILPLTEILGQIKPISVVCMTVNCLAMAADRFKTRSPLGPTCLNLPRRPFYLPRAGTPDGNPERSDTVRTRRQRRVQRVQGARCKVPVRPDTSIRASRKCAPCPPGLPDRDDCLQASLGVGPLQSFTV
jgi:hypothetical protein